MPLGYLCLVLHAHLPFVRHPEYDDERVHAEVLAVFYGCRAKR